MGNSERRASRSSCGAVALFAVVAVIVVISSSALPFGRPLFQERLDALLLVGGGEAEAEEVALVGDAVLDWQPLAGPQRLLGDLEGERALRRDLVGQLQRLRPQLLGRDDELH